MLEGFELYNYVTNLLGGVDRLVSMIGLTGSTYSKNSVIYFFRAKSKKKINVVEIVYNYGPDSFEMIFSNFSNLEVKVIERYSDVYIDQLVSLFETVTGLYLSF